MPGTRIGVAFLALLFASGCGNQRPSVAGKITLDGEPLETGSIAFYPIDGTDSPSAGAVIHKGDYEIPSEKGPKPGAFRVEISAQRKTGRRVPAGSPNPPGTLVDEFVEAVPENYNKNSTLRFDVKAGNNSASFELTTK